MLQGSSLFSRLLPALFLVFLASLLPCASAQQAIQLPNDSQAQTAIREITFEKVTALFKEDQQKLCKSLQQEDSGWVTRQTPAQLAHYIEDRVLDLYQERGYWRARIFVQVTWVRGSGEQRQVDALITAINEGEQYRLKEIRWNGVTAFPQPELQKMLGIRASDSVNRSRLAKGLEAVHRLYLSRGYIAYSAVPQTEFDDAAHTISLVINVSEDSPFHFGTLAIEGMDRDGSRKLQQGWGQMHRQLYSPEKLRVFFEKFLPGMPPGADPLDYSNSSIDLDNHTVDIFVNFLPAQAEKR
jgi:outer membrane protein assembly factor BamA